MLDTYEQKYTAVYELRRWLCGDSGRFSDYALPSWSDGNGKPGNEGPMRWVRGWGDGVKNGCLMMGWWVLTVEGKADDASHMNIVAVDSSDLKMTYGAEYVEKVEAVAQAGAEALGFKDVNAVIQFNDSQGDITMIAKHLDKRLVALGELAAYEIDDRESARVLRERDAYWKQFALV